MHALAEVGLEVGRGGLCRLLGRFASQYKSRASSRGKSRASSKSEKVRVVFDGSPPYGPLAKQIETDSIDVRYSAGRTADDLIIQAIAADSAPRRLTVVSTDREISKAARSRRCRTTTSEEFAGELVRMLERSRMEPDRRNTEPPEKRVGLAPEQTRAWLKKLNIEKENFNLDEGEDLL